MADTTKILALKPYLEAVANCCRKLSYDELCELISEIAQEVSPQERARFLMRLESRPENEETQTEVELDDELLERIRDLKEEIAERQEAIEDGTYYEEYGDYEGYGDYYDEEIEALSDEQREELGTLFAETDHLFLANELELARRAYQSLLNMFDSVGHEDEEEEETIFYYSFSEYDVNINWRETRSRYCRCVYETSSSEERIARMLQAMEIDVNQFDSRYAPSEEKYPLLQDVFDAKAGELPDREDFLKAWRDALERYATNRANILFLEAVNWLEGVDGVAREVRKQRAPVGYLYWLDQLTSRQAWQEAGEIAQEALDNIPEGELRAQAAEILSSAGVKTGSQGLVLQGKREGFYSTPNMARLASFIEEADRQDLRNEELENALNLLNTKEHVIPLRVHVLLMLGRLDEASKLVDTEKSLGWSYGGAGIGVLFGGLLTALTHADAQGVTIQTLLKRYAGTGSSYSLYSFKTQESETDALILREILQGLQHLPMEESQKQAWLTFAKKMGGGRIDGIVSNQHRKAYDRAAEVLGALMECCLLNEQPGEARALLETYRNQKYKRHSAFRKELDAVLRNSTLLRPYYSKR